MFKFLLAFLVWLFATGKYADWVALLTAPASSTSASTSPSSQGTSTGTSSAGSANLLGALGSLGGLVSSGSENTGASSTSTPDDLIAGYTS